MTKVLIDRDLLLIVCGLKIRTQEHVCLDPIVGELHLKRFEVLRNFDGGS